MYEIEIDEDDGLGTRLLDPVQEVAKCLGSPFVSRSYHHDGDSAFLLGVVDPSGHKKQRKQKVLFPPPGRGTERSPLLHLELEALVRCLRDSEVVSVGPVAGCQVRNRISTC